MIRVHGYINEYVLTGNITNGLGKTEEEAKAAYQKRDWSDYVNTSYNAISAQMLTKSKLDSWYSKYIMGGASADVKTESTFQKIYTNGYYKYQNIIDIYSWYWLGEAAGSTHLYAVSGSERTAAMYGASFVKGIRILVTLSPDVQFTWERTNTKTLNGGNMDTYGKEQTYNVWGIEPTNQEPPIVDVVEPVWKAENINIDQTNQQVTFDLTGTDKYFDSAEALSIFGEDTNKNGVLDDGEDTNENGVLDGGNIKVYVDGVDMTYQDYVNAEIGAPTELKETRTVNGVETEVTYGVKYTVTIKDWIEPSRQVGKLYTEWSGYTTVKILEGAIQDLNGNGSKELPVVIGDVDFIEPEFTYEYSETDIGSGPTGDKKVKMVFSVADRYYDEADSQILNVDDLTILIDGEEPLWRDEDEGQDEGVIRTLTSQKEEREINGETVTIGYTYTLTLEELTVDNSKTYLDYSGIVTVGIPEGIVEDTSNRENTAKTIVLGGIIGESETLEGLVSSKGLAIGDFVNYDAGTWTQDEIDAIQVGLKSNLVTASGRTELSTTGFQFGGFKEGSSRNGNATNQAWTIGGKECNYLRDAETEEPLTGWRVFDVNDDKTITLISAGDPEHYYHPSTFETNNNVPFSTGEATQYVLTGMRNENNNALYNTLVDFVQKRNWNDYVNEQMGAVSASSLDAIDIDKWLRKYTGMQSLNNTSISLFRRNYPVLQNIIFNDSGYYLGSVYSGNYLYYMTPNNLSPYFDRPGGIRIIVTLSADTVFKRTETTKTITGQLMENTQTYNVWDIVTDTETQIADVVDPVWELGDVSLGDGIVKLRVTDKYIDLENSNFEDSHIKVIIDGTEVSNCAQITSTENIIDGQVVGREYTVQLSNVTPDEGGYTEFTPVEAIVGGTAKYRNEGGGNITIQIDPGTITDTSGNVDAGFTTNLSTTDASQVEVFEVQKTQNKAENKETIIFNVTDRYYDSTNLIELENNEITIKIDGVDVPAIKKPATTAEQNANKDKIWLEYANTPVEILQTATRCVGHQYTLVISNIAQAVRQTGKEYLEWSGTLEVKIAQDASNDTSGNTMNTTTTTISDFVDYVNPEVQYQYTDSSQAVAGDIDYDGKTFTMVFDIVDKYYKNSILAAEDLTIAIDGEIPGDENGNGVIDGTENLRIIPRPSTVAEQNANKDKVWYTFEGTDIEAETAFNKTVEGAIVNDNHVIGKSYTLVLSNLEQLQIADGDQYLDFSGVITVKIPAGSKDASGNLVKGIIDEAGNLNVETTITSGIDIPGGVAGDAEIVDVVDPLWQKKDFEIDFENQTATITVEGTDKYYASSDLTNKLEVHVDGEKVTEGITITPGTASVINKTGTTDQQVGDEYEITVTGFPKDAKQVKLVILENAMLDTSGNGNKVTGFLIYNTLRKAESTSGSDETSATSGFLGNETIQRQNIEKIQFVANLDDAPIIVAANGTITLGTNCWDVSAKQDKSILAWTEQTVSQSGRGIYTVYIGSNDDIYGNIDSSHLFSYIGYSTTCTATDTISGINLLHTINVTDMQYMFSNCGRKAMQSLDLGSNFNTINVTNMKGLFSSCGYTAMQNLDLGANFNTTNVEIMSGMFNSCGYTAMQSLDLGANFNTTKVTDMSDMFNSCGYTAMTSLNLGNKFDTRNVTNMSFMFFKSGYTAMTSLDLSSGTTVENTTQFNTSSVTDMALMFCYTGYEKMHTLNLGNNFNTSNVTSMSSMFEETGKKLMTELDLGDLFYTTSATSMTSMFNGCGQSKMTVLDLGPAFTKIASTNTDFITSTGTSGCVIYAPESIYKNTNAFKLNGTDTTETPTSLQYTTGTINPVYKPEWKLVSSKLQQNASGELTGIMEIVVKGSANKTFTNGDYTGTYTSDVMSTLPVPASGSKIELTGANAGLINVLIDGEPDGGTITKTITAGTDSSSGVAEVYYTIELDLLEEVRQSGKSFKEWSGNISLQFASGTLVDQYGSYLTGTVPTVNVFQDASGNYIGNKNLAEIEIKHSESPLTANTANPTTDAKMFSDVIKPEFTYKASETIIGSGPTGDKKVRVIFDIIDKYYNSSTIIADVNDITIAMLDRASGAGVNTAVSKSISKKTIDADTTDANGLTYKTNGDIYYNGNKVGERYELVLENFDQGSGFDYSGPMSITIPSGIATDNSSNTNNETIIVIGVDNPNEDEDVVIEESVITADDYGGYVTNYLPRNGSTVGWRIFYADEDNIYLIADDYISNTEAPDGRNGIAVTAGLDGRNGAFRPLNIVQDTTSENKYLGTVDWDSSIASKWLSKYPNESTNNNAKATSYFLDTEVWSVFKDNAGYAEYAIGGPTLELFAASYNAKNTDITITTSVPNSSADGYHINGTTSISNLSSSDELYYIETWTDSSGMWIASPHAQSDSAMICMSYTGTLGHTEYTYNLAGARPVVALKSNCGLQKQDDDTYKIVSTIEPPIVDVVNPVWEEGTHSLSEGIIKVRAKDKYYSTSHLSAEDITVKVNNTPTNAFTAVVTGPVEIVEGQEYEYTIQMSTASVEGDDTFTPDNVAELVTGENGFKYASGNGGNISIEIAGGTITDESGNINNATPLEIGMMDETKPKVYEVQKTQNPAAGTMTIIFNVTDKNYDESELVALDEISLWIDGVETNSITKAYAANTPKAIIKDGVTVGHQYTLILSDIVETLAEYAASGREYKELSGTLQVKIDEDAVKDLDNNTLNTATTTISDFIDYIQPEIRYQYAESSQAVAGDINYQDKTFTMVFDIIDKYYQNSTLTAQDLIIAIDGEIPGDENGNGVIDGTENLRIIPRPATVAEENANKDKVWYTFEEKINITTQTADIIAETAFNKTVDGAFVNDNHVIGKSYELVLSNLEQLQIADGEQYLDFSGVITVEIPAGKITDTKGNGNVQTTITSGIDIPGGTASDAEVVDVVDPLWQKTDFEIDFENQTATITVEGTDKYYASSDLTNKLEVHVDGEKVTEGITITPGTASVINKTGTTDQQVGDEYEITVTGFPKDAKQVKLVILENAMLDTSGNGNKVTGFLIYNTLRKATKISNGSWEGDENSGFLGNENILRANIEKIQFVDNLNGNDVPITIAADGTITLGTNCWDVSAKQDKSILAWTKQTGTQSSRGVYTVYIGSNDDIYGNIDSRYLFSYIGYSTNCTETNTISGIDKLHTINVTNMSNMFYYCGITKMSTLDLGSNFDTRNVKDMGGMFHRCGHDNMENFDLGDKFDTSKVENMKDMFYRLGYTRMQTLSLGSNFDTSQVKDMTGMFHKCGFTAMTSLDLGSNFDTSQVKDMNNMFNECGASQMTTLDLGSKFNTINVTDMEHMFRNMLALTNLKLGENFDTRNVENMAHMFCYLNAMEYLDLGDKFYTTSATNMNRMFRSSSSLEVLDLGPNFTRIADGIVTYEPPEGTLEEIPAYTYMFEEIGADSCVIYAPESIYKNANAFKLNSTDTTATPTSLQYTRGTINPIYKPEWELVSSKLKQNASGELTGVMEIVVKGSANKTFTNGTYTGTYTSDVMSTLPVPASGSEIELTGANAGLINVLIDGEPDGGTVTKTITAGTNSSSGVAEVYYTIELDLLEEVRQSGKSFKEWSGNISLQFARGTLVDKYGSYIGTETQTDENGNPVEVELPIVNVFKDASATYIGNKNLAEIEIKHPESPLTANTANPTTDAKMFSDVIKPEFTYKASETIIGSGAEGDKKVRVIFSITDKYFNNSTITSNANSVTIAMLDGAASGTGVNTAVTKTITTTKILVLNTETNTVEEKDTTYTVQSTERKVGEKYELLLENFDQGLGFDYSGPMSITFPSGIATDNSSNTNNQTTITIGVNEEDGNSNESAPSGGTIVDVVNPVWEEGTHILSDGIIKVRAKDKYYSSSELTPEDIKVFVNGVLDGDTNKNGTIDSGETANIVKTVSNDVVEITAGKEYEHTIQLSNITVEGSKTFTPDNVAELVTGPNGFEYSNDNGGNISIEIAEGTITDQSGNVNNATIPPLEIGIMDETQPQIYPVQKIQNATQGQVTIIFNVTDKNYDSSKLISLEEITVTMDGVETNSISKAYATNTPKQIIENGIVVGHQYTVILSDIVETSAEFTASGREYQELSGTIGIQIDEEAAKDIDGNTLNTTTTTIRDFVDFIKPQLKEETVTNPINTTDKTYTMSFSVIDKYLDTTDLVTEDEILVYIDGELDGDTNGNGQLDAGETPTIVKEIISETPITAQTAFNKTISGTVDADGEISAVTITNSAHTIGYTYTLQLSEFEQDAKQTAKGKNFMEWSGTVSIVIAQNATNDINPITNTEINTLDTTVANRTIQGEYVDFIKPVIETIEPETSSRGTDTETIYFDVLDKYLANADQDVITSSEITVYIDGEPVTVDYDNLSATGLNGTLRRVDTYTATVNGDSTHIVGQKFELVLSGFEQASRNAKGYKDYSGTVSIEIAANAVQDNAGNTLDLQDDKRTIVGDFVDFIAPNIKYVHGGNDINYGADSYTMTFDITDKYYSSGKIEYSDLSISMQNGQLDADGDQIIYDLVDLAEDEIINISFSNDDEITATFKKTVGGSVETEATSHVIGHKYTLTISNLEKLEIAPGLTTADYSGIITVEIPEKVKDAGPSGDGTNQHSNAATSITSGVNIPGGTGNGTVVDVVDPLWNMVSSSATVDPTDTVQSTAEVTIRGTDTYFYGVDDTTTTDDDGYGILESDEIQIYVNNVLQSTIIPTISTPTPKMEYRSDSDEEVQYGVEYTISFTGFASDANQVKVKILEDAIIDQSGNGNKETDIIVYNVLKSTSSEVISTSPFLGETLGTTVRPQGLSSITAIQRQDIENVIFVNNINGLTADGVQRVWEVSAQNDGSILAWTYNDAAPYTVYIGSKWEIFANQDSKYLFANIGAGDSCNDTEVITTESLERLNTSSVTDMSYMFNNFGHKAMTKLELGAFDTTYVTTMQSMFDGCGYNALKDFSFGDNFNTTKVQNMSGMFQNFGAGSAQFTTLDLGATGVTFNTNAVNNMSNMFNSCGQTALTTFSLGNSFNTANVENMSGMFQNFAYKLETLTLGNNFNIVKVTDMSNMFNGAGQTSMKTLTLGNNFNTATVQNMSGMFQDFAKSQMTSLDLGNLFYTTSATNMDNMFNGCGQSNMITLDLGPAFTKIATDHENFMTNCGTSTLKIYAPESIYANITAFKLNQ